MRTCDGTSGDWRAHELSEWLAPGLRLSRTQRAELLASRYMDEQKPALSPPDNGNLYGGLYPAFRVAVGNGLDCRRDDDLDQLVRGSAEKSFRWANGDNVRMGRETGSNH